MVQNDMHRASIPIAVISNLCCREFAMSFPHVSGGNLSNQRPSRHFLSGIHLGCFSDGYLPQARRYDGRRDGYRPPTGGRTEGKMDTGHRLVGMTEERDGSLSPTCGMKERGCSARHQARPPMAWCIPKGDTYCLAHPKR